MVETRRQSGKLPPPLREAQASDEVNPSEEDYELESESQSDSGSEWGDDSLRKRGKLAAKRVKTMVKQSISIGKTRKQRPNLSLLPTMPLDLLFEIFGLLAPKDLIMLSRTSKPLRHMLLSRNAITIWKAARESLFGPACPHDVSEPRWAILLFGETNCQECGTSRVQRIDFALRRRVCTACLQENLVYSSKFREKFPDLDATIMDLIPHTNTGGWSHGHASGSKFYWEADIYDMAVKLGAYQKDVHMRKPGAKQKLEGFIINRTNIVKTILPHAKDCQMWSVHTAQQRLDDVQARKQKRYDAIKARFLQLGYLESDCSGLYREHGVYAETELTDRIWVHIRRTLEPSILQRKNNRIAAERAALIESRKQLVPPLYRDYKRTLVPAQWAYLPRTDDIYEFSAFKTGLDAEDEAQTTEASFEEAMTLLSGLIVAWSESRKRKLAQMMLATMAEPAGPLLIPTTNDTTLASVAGGSGLSKPSQHTPSSVTIDSFCCLYLATAVFKCATPNCGNNVSPFGGGLPKVLLAWDDAGAHGCRRNVNPFYQPAGCVDTKLEFNKRGSAAAMSLVSWARLDVRSATPADMDKLDLRFVCLDCEPQIYYMNIYGRKALSWRACISHFTASRHQFPTWQLLTPAETLAIKSAEGPDPACNDLSWTCNHCAAHLDDWKSRQDVVQHLRTMHNISYPTEPAHLFYYPGQQRSPHLPVVFVMPRPVPKQKGVAAVNPRAIYQCRHCPNSNRMFEAQGVKQHLQAKHEIPSPVFDEDWGAKLA